MREPYDVTSYFEFLGYGRGDQTYHCADLTSVIAYFRGDEAQLEELLRPTPFTLADDRFAVSIADFTRNSGATYIDAAVILAVRYGDLVGGTYYHEFEDKHGSVAGGRELWGYPKRYAKICFEADAHGARADVSNEGASLFSLDFTFDDTVDGSGWAGLSLYPHLQVRAVPQYDGPTFQSFDILSRDTSKDYVLKTRRYGRGAVRFGAALAVAGQPLHAVPLGAELTVGDYASTAANGVPTHVAALV
ncbi:acetoacetate decarboxylase family protein [Micromonospora sp. NPDC023633]|uniref:acetoacetate decarboxylase family protein n=1 Tax=Micromonospora sp. NPDC023633 TaxID=3154320 RepID=UPI0033D880AF